MEAQNLAQRIAEFIRHNNIDPSEVPMDAIVQEFFKAQLSAIENAGNQALEILA
jgi:hypothetical protein